MKGGKEKFNSYEIKETQIHVRSYPISSFQQCPILSMRPLLLVKLFTVSDTRCLLQDDEIEDYDDYDDDYVDEDDQNYITNSKDTNNYPIHICAEASNRQNTVHETYLLESNFISRNPLIGNDFAAIKNSVVKCAPLAEADQDYITNPQDSNNYPIHISAEASSRKNTAHETYLFESNFISRNPPIGNDFAAIKNSVVKCAPLAELSLIHI